MKFKNKEEKIIFNNKAMLPLEPYKRSSTLLAIEISGLTKKIINNFTKNDRKINTFQLKSPTGKSNNIN